MDKRRNLKERICAAVLALALVLTGVLPDVGTRVLAADVLIPKAEFFVYEEYTDESGQLQEIPIKGATVIAAGADRVVSETDGRCSVGDINVGTLCTVSRSGYKTETINITEASNKVRLEMKDIEPSCGSQLVMNRSENPTTSIRVNDAINDANELSYEWISDNPDVISVSNDGIVTANQRGSANITIKRGNMAESMSVTAKEEVSFDFSINPASGTDQTEVAITVGALPSDATGSVSVYKGSETTAPIKQNVDKTGETITWTENDIEKLQGNVVFIAKYEAGQDDVYLNTRKELTGNYLKSVTLKLEPSTNTPTYTYGTDTSITITDLFKISGAGNGQIVHYKSDKVGVAKVNEDGANISITGAGTAVISAYVEEDKDKGYTASSVEYTLKIDAKDIGEVSLDDFQWEAVDGTGNQTTSKVYDGDNHIRVKGTLESSASNGIMGNDTITVYANAKLDGANAGSYTEFMLEKSAEIDASQNPNYTFTIKEAGNITGEDKKFELSADTAKFGFKDGNEFKINKREIYV